MKILFLSISILSLAWNAGASSVIVKGDGVAQTKDRISTVMKAAANFYTDCGFYPKNIYGLIVDIDNCEHWGPEPYFKQTATLSDVWSRPLIFTHLPNGKLEIKSLGPTDSDKKSPKGEIVVQGP